MHKYTISLAAMGWAMLATSLTAAGQDIVPAPPGPPPVVLTEMQTPDELDQLEFTGRIRDVRIFTINGQPHMLGKLDSRSGQTIHVDLGPPRRIAQPGSFRRQRRDRARHSHGNERT